MIFRRNVLIFHTGALGDFVLTWPLAMALARLYPQSRIIYITHQQKGLLAQKVLGVEYADVEMGWHRLFGDDVTLPRESNKLLTSAHSIYTFLEGQNFDSLSPETRIFQLKSPLDGIFSCHASQFLVEQLHEHPAVRSAMQQILLLISQHGLGRQLSKGTDILIHPGSGSREKCWPPDRFAQLTQRLIEAGFPVRVVLGEVELERLDKEQIQMFESFTSVEYPKTYLELHDLISQSRLVITNDSGPGHLAGISGVPTLCLFGPTEETRWKPLGPRVQTLRGRTLNDLDVETVFRAASEM